jgi:hypothetical protein
MDFLENNALFFGMINAFTYLENNKLIMLKHK